MMVLVIGDALVDQCVWVKKMPARGSDETILSSAEHSGGSALNTSFRLSGLGVLTGFCGCIGDDESGRNLLKKMHDSGIDTSLVRTEPGSTGHTITIIDGQGERTMLSDRGLSARSLILTDEIREKIRQIRLLCLSGYWLIDPAQTEFVIQCAAYARSQGVTVMLDPCPTIRTVEPATVRRILDVIDIFAPNRDELAAVTGTDDIEKSFSTLETVIPALLLKMGAKGSMLQLSTNFPKPAVPGSSRRFRAPAPHVTPINTTGAGDVYNAAFIASYLSGKTPEEWLRDANACAAEWVAG
ncbi:hypothetical protein FACS1894172_19700 [Spirochaetia bacterium]|nr:hypothetical protein FACS1894164_07060 [Spirochaetia bacterium]GHU36666.1 hypothetical protein FACS1894172_19700 [Spirochaetia bacterium]